MPGLSSRNPVAGYGNIGKVQIRFKPKPQKKPLYGAILFLFCACLLLFSWSWTDPWKRNTIILPTMRSILRHIDTYRIQMTNKSSDNKTNQFKIDFDDLGRAIISGDSIQKVLFGQGYEHAKNRIFQMDLNRHKAYGSLSSWQGERALSTDMMARVMNISSLARSDFAAHNDIEREYLQSYCDGVNSFIQEGNALPVEYKLLGLNEIEPWTPLDSLVLLRYHSTLSSEIWEVELTQYMVSQETKSTNFTSAFAFPRHENGIDKTSATVIPSVSSSTAWVMQPIASMSPSTASAPLPLHSTRIVTEPHAPSMYIDNSLYVPDKLHVTGASLPGVPFVWMGRNNNISWSFTPSSIDTEDLFQESIPEYVSQDEHTATCAGSRCEEVMKQFLHSYSFTESTPAGEGDERVVTSSEVWNTVGVRKEVFTIYDAKNSTEPELREIDIYYTSRGPLILPYLSSTSVKALVQSKVHISLCRAGDYGDMKISALMKTNMATDWDSFVGALHGLEGASMNVLYSDSKGNIASTITGRSPVRVEGHEGSAIAPGAGFAWRGTESSLDCEECEAAQYRNFNPSSKLLVSAPWHSVDSQFIRELQQSAAASGFSAADAMRIECNNHAESLHKLKEIVLETPDDSFSPEAVIAKLLLESNEESAPDLQRVFLEAFRIEVADALLRQLQSLGNIFRGESHTPLKLSNVYSGNFHWLHTILEDSHIMSLAHSAYQNGGRNELIATAADKALEWTKKHTKSWLIPFSWEIFHAARFAHHLQQFEYMGEVLSPGPVSVQGGAWDAVRQTGTTSSSLKYARHGMGCGLTRWGMDGVCRLETYRSFYEMGSDGAAYSISPPGISERPGSPHYISMLPLWQRCEMGRIYWNSKRTELVGVVKDDGERGNEL